MLLLGCGGYFFAVARSNREEAEAAKAARQGQPLKKVAPAQTTGVLYLQLDNAEPMSYEAYEKKKKERALKEAKEGVSRKRRQVQEADVLNFGADTAGLDDIFSQDVPVMRGSDCPADDDDELMCDQVDGRAE